MKNVVKVIISIGSILTIVSLLGCARFNTFYNAEQFFKQAQKAREKSKTAQPSSSEIELYDKAIKKASKILTFHPKSKLVDDALLLVGRSYYGKGEYLKAARKFTELIDNFPQSELVYEASFWLGTCYYSIGYFDKAEQALASIVNQKGAKKWAAEAQFLLAEMAFQEERFGYAIEEYRKVVGRFSGNPRSAEAQYRIGQCLTILDRPTEAREAYEHVFKFDPQDTIELNANFSIGQSLREEGKYDQAIDVFKKLLKDSRNIEYFGAIRLEIAECEAERGDLEEAISDYEDIIEDYPKSESSAEAHYQLGLIYLNVLGDQVMAKEHFGVVKTEYAKSMYANEAQLVGRNIEALTKLYDQLMPPPADSTESESESESESQDTEEELPDLTLDAVIAEMMSGYVTTDGQAGAPDTEAETADSTKAKGPQKPKKTQATAVDTPGVHFKLAELYLLQFSKADSALRHYQVVVDQFPDSKYGDKSAFAIAWVTDVILNDPLAAQEAYLRVIEDFPNTSYDDAARQALGDTLPVDEELSASLRRFAEAEQMFHQGGDLDSLVYAYQSIIDQYPESPYAPKAGFAIAWMMEHIKSDRQEATDAYQSILDTYGDTEYAAEAKLKLGLKKPPTTKRTTPQQQQKERPKDEAPERELTLEDIEQEMLQEGPIAVAEPEVGIQLQP